MENTLKQKIMLSDGSKAHVFIKEQSQQLVKSAILKSGNIFINCHLCRVGKLPAENIMTHANGKRHLKNLASTPNAVEFRKPLEEKETTQLVRDKLETTVKLPISFKQNSTAPWNIDQVPSTAMPFLKPADLHEQANKAGEEVYKKEKFKVSLELEMKRLYADHDLHKKKPEQHPKYADEWKKFWERRFQELKKEKKVNPNDYDYKSEWIGFWMNRMEEILSKNIEIKKRTLRRELGLPSDYNEEVVPRERKRSHTPEKISDYEVISSEDSMSDEEFYHQQKRRLRYESPPRQREYYKCATRHRTYYESTGRESPLKEPSPVFDENEPVTLITVCRLLSALESELGTLSNNVLDLLSKALALEKCKPNSSDELLMTTENSVFFETVKEKMKGLLMVNVLPPQKIVAVKKCIQNIAKLIHQTPVIDVNETATEPTEADDEKGKIAVEIAAALKAHGKEDCTPEELEVLVEMFLEPQVAPEIETPEKVTNFEALDDNDLKILLSNFSELESDEQDHVIKFLSDMEKREPERVDALRSYVKLNDAADNNNNRKEEEVIEIDDDPDDYNFNEAVKSVVANFEVQRKPESSLTDNLLSINKNRSSNSWN